ncbi:hypothetical protein B0T19DRAFT_200781 [Cercophora scortea]|uniref:Uncharacterized protein n=1 Tax=Cercophora scortea TaxID=314031 RepID=A0AAE0M9B1_9PEZI|nr:hypothetical protein B0T19DRAFT_200781 [Cercophora scortea]
MDIDSAIQKDYAEDVDMEQNAEAPGSPDITHFLEAALATAEDNKHTETPGPVKSQLRMLDRCISRLGMPQRMLQRMKLVQNGRRIPLPTNPQTLKAHRARVVCPWLSKPIPASKEPITTRATCPVSSTSDHIPRSAATRIPNSRIARHARP